LIARFQIATETVYGPIFKCSYKLKFQFFQHAFPLGQKYDFLALHALQMYSFGPIQAGFYDSEILIKTLTKKVLRHSHLRA